MKTITLSNSQINFLSALEFLNENKTMFFDGATNVTNKINKTKFLFVNENGQHVLLPTNNSKSIAAALIDFNNGGKKIIAHNIDPTLIGYNSTEEFDTNMENARIIYAHLFDLTLHNANCTN